MIRVLVEAVRSISSVVVENTKTYRQVYCSGLPLEGERSFIEIFKGKERGEKDG